jgi:hypothetical protein
LPTPVKKHEIRESRELEVIDGRLIESGTITTMENLNLGIRGYPEQLPAFV